VRRGLARVSAAGSGAGAGSDARARRRALLGVLAVALAARLVSLSLFWDARLVFDEKWYVSVASSIAAGEGYRTFGSAEPTALRPPLFAALLGAEIWIASHVAATESWGWLRALQIPPSLLTVAFLFQLCARRFGTRAALGTGLAAALAPPLVQYSFLLWSESLAAMWLAALFLCLDRFGERRRARDLAFAGAVLGLLVLTKQAWLYFAAPIALWSAWRLGFERRASLRALAAGLAALALTLAPWTARNALAFGDFVLVSSMQWWPIAIGNLDPPTLAAKRELMREATRLPEANREAFYRGVALESIARQLPGWLPRKLVSTIDGLYQIRSEALRFAEEGWIETTPARVRALVAYQVLGHYGLVAPGIAALWLVPGGALQLLVACAVLYLNGLHTLANAITRYAVALLPLYLLYLGPLATGAWRAQRPRPWQWAGAALSVAAFVWIPAPRSWSFLAELLGSAAR
jgi:4-amino-4-deoxy-L-arabinose transferase-like glycosyltransferase